MKWVSRTAASTIAARDVKRYPKLEETNGRMSWGMVEIGERPSTRSTTSLLWMPLNSLPPPPRTFPTFGIMEPRAGARPRVLAVISRLFGFITVAAIIEKFSRASRPDGETAFRLSLHFVRGWIHRGASNLNVSLLGTNCHPSEKLNFYDIENTP